MGNHPWHLAVAFSRYTHDPLSHSSHVPSFTDHQRPNHMRFACSLKRLLHCFKSCQIRSQQSEVVRVRPVLEFLDAPLLRSFSDSDIREVVFKWQHSVPTRRSCKGTTELCLSSRLLYHSWDLMFVHGISVHAHTLLD